MAKGCLILPLEYLFGFNSMLSNLITLHDRCKFLLMNEGLHTLQGDDIYRTIAWYDDEHQRNYLSYCLVFYHKSPGTK